MTNEYLYKVTVGFPVYNVEKYIRRSLKSILDQDLDNYEIIIVDDCGADNSMIIVNDLIENYPSKGHIKIIRHKKNSGLAIARNTAIMNAQGKYIYFVDSDDYITTDALRILYDSAEKYQAEVVIGSNYKQKNTEIWIDKSDVYPDIQFLKKNEFKTLLYNNIKDIMPDTAWNILFSMEFLRNNKLLFPDIRFQEDIAFDTNYHPCIQRIAFIHNLTYYYLLRADSLMNFQHRDSIGINEAIRSVELCKLMKNNLPKWKDDPFYGGICAKTLKRCFFQVAGIIKHRGRFTGDLSDKEIKSMVKHPDSIINILSYKQLRLYNIFYYILGVLPAKLSIFIIRIICKKKGYLKIYHQDQL
jgi:glycosyltransferase involved in cell wall biosynthesis